MGASSSAAPAPNSPVQSSPDVATAVLKTLRLLWCCHPIHLQSKRLESTCLKIHVILTKATNTRRWSSTAVPSPRRLCSWPTFCGQRRAEALTGASDSAGSPDAGSWRCERQRSQGRQSSECIDLPILSRLSDPGQHAHSNRNKDSARSFTPDHSSNMFLLSKTRGDAACASPLHSAFLPAFAAKLLPSGRWKCLIAVVHLASSLNKSLFWRLRHTKMALFQLAF